MTTELEAGSCRAGDPHCITCGDEGVPMRVLELDDSFAECADDEQAIHSVAIDLVEPVEVGDELLVHAGVAIARLGMVR
jgi:hydrogenase expression/formation protein HypC